LWIVIAAFVVSAAAVFSRSALADFSFSDVEELLRKRNRTKQDQPRLERFADRLRQTRFGFRLLDDAARVSLAVGLWLVFAELQVAWPWAWWAGSVALSLLVLDSLIRPLSAAYAEQVTLAMLRPWTAMYLLMWLPMLPFRATYDAVEALLRSQDAEGNGDQSDDEILAAVSLGEYAGQIDEQEREMIESVLGLDQLTVDRLMTPRTEMQAVPIDDGVAGAVALAKQSGHSRLPVYDGNRDNIVGICYVKDLIGIPADELPELDRVLRPPLLVPESKEVSELLKEFRRNRIHLAIVIDEYGGTAGLITIEDIIEEVFGDIDDEYDTEDEDEVRSIGDSDLDLDARMHVDEVNERFDLNLPENERYESLAGLITSQLGRIPEVGDVWEGEGIHLTVLEATDRRVVRVRLTRQEHRRESETPVASA